MLGYMHMPTMDDRFTQSQVGLMMRIVVAGQVHVQRAEGRQQHGDAQNQAQQ